MNNNKISNISLVSSRNKSRSRNREESEKRDAGRLKAFENIFGLGIFYYKSFETIITFGFFETDW